MNKHWHERFFGIRGLSAAEVMRSFSWREVFIHSAVTLLHYTSHHYLKIYSYFLLSKVHQMVMWYLRDWFLDPSFSPYRVQYFARIHHPLLWWQTALLYISTRWSHGSCIYSISDCLADIIVWMKEHHLQVNLVKTEFFNFPPTPTVQHNFTIQLGSSTLISTRPATNLRAIFDNQLIFKDHTESMVILVWITQHQGYQALSAQLLILVFWSLSFLGWTIAILFWLAFHRVQLNLYTWSRKQQHDWSPMCPKVLSSHISTFLCNSY